MPMDEENELRFIASVAAQIRAEISAAGLTVADVMRITGLSRSSMDRYTKGERDIPLLAFYQISTAVGVPMDVILRRANERLKDSQLD